MSEQIEAKPAASRHPRGSTAATRRYRKRLRAEQEQQTRLRITEATVKLHGTIGLAHTTVQAIAKEAGVQRATVYAHFPDADALMAACSAHFFSLHPPPDEASWRSISDPDARLRTALGELYAWYAQTEPMLSNIHRDVEYVPASLRARRIAQGDAINATLLAGRPERGRARERVAAAIGHATAFPTWRSLVRDQGLSDTDAVRLMVATANAAARP
jgi:AcrR family transcriptional regulator